MLYQHYPQPPVHNYLFELNKDMTFSSAHYIPNEKAGPCQRVHGHNYTCNVTIVGDKLDEMGFLINFKEIKDLIHGRYDHQMLNQKMLTIPSTEKVAEAIWSSVQCLLETLPNKPKCIQVVLRETPTSYVIYRPKGLN